MVSGAESRGFGSMERKASHTTKAEELHMQKPPYQPSRSLGTGTKRLLSVPGIITESFGQRSFVSKPCLSATLFQLVYANLTHTLSLPSQEPSKPTCPEREKENFLRANFHQNVFLPCKYHNRRAVSVFNRSQCLCLSVYVWHVISMVVVAMSCLLTRPNGIVPITPPPPPPLCKGHGAV